MKGRTKVFSQPGLNSGKKQFFLPGWDITVTDVSGFCHPGVPSDPVLTTDSSPELAGIFHKTNEFFPISSPGRLLKYGYFLDFNCHFIWSVRETK